MMFDDRILILDLEASAPEGYPIEIGFADLDLSTGAIDVSSKLIKPPKAWVDNYPWDEKSAALHGISREMLEKEGVPVETVAAFAAAMIGSRTVRTSALVADHDWLSMLLEHTPRKPKGQVSPLYGIMMLAETTLSDIDERAVELGLRPHRAGDGAHLIALHVLAMHRPEMVFKTG